MKNDFVIQVIGSENSGKTKIVFLISKALEEAGVNVEHYQFYKIDNDFCDINGKKCFITEFITESERDLESESEKKDNEDIKVDRIEVEDFKNAFVKTFGGKDEATI